MALDSYSALQTSVISWAMRSGDADFAAAVPDFIRLSEERFNNTLNVRQMETTVTLIPDVNGVCTLPDDYQGFRNVSVAYSGYNVDLELLAPDLANKLHPSPVAGGSPAGFTIVDNSLTVIPTSTGNVTLTYWAKVPALSVSNTTNWLLTQAPSIYLYGALLEAATFMMDDAGVQKWSMLFKTAIDNLNSSDRDQRYSRVVSRVRGYTP
jgi:hypothetical protein